MKQIIDITINKHGRYLYSFNIQSPNDKCNISDIDNKYRVRYSKEEIDIILEILKEPKLSCMYLKYKSKSSVVYDMNIHDLAWFVMNNIDRVEYNIRNNSI